MSFLIFDLILLAVLALAVFRGYRKGFVLTLCGFLAVFVAFLGATILSDALAEPMSHLVRPAVETSIRTALEDSLEEQGIVLPEPDASSQDPGAEPGEDTDVLGETFSLEQILELIGDSALVQYFSDAIQSAVNQGVLSVTTNIVEAIAGYIALKIAHALLFLICFVLVLAGWYLLSHALDLAFRLPVLSTLNHWAGAGMGLVKGAALMFIACWLLRDLFPPKALESTLLLRFFCTTNPFALIAGFF